MVDMSKVQFAVSAKTARLIGRENISDVDGAIIELIKNSYDADATCAYVQFNIPFPSIPKSISYYLYNSVFSKSDCFEIRKYYIDNGNCFTKQKELSPKQEMELGNFLFSKNSIIVMDNGCGMDEKTLRLAWMNIGTNDKEEKRISVKGRIKTGAKGIGRFALDKLSKSTTVFTKSNDDVLKEWCIDWEQFETASLLNEVSATIENVDGTFCNIAKKITDGRFKSFENYTWNSGTIIKLSPTREVWSEEYFAKVNKNLKSLFPGKNDSEFDIYVTNLFYPEYSFNNERFVLNDSEYDYKIKSSFDGRDNVTVRILRNEVDTRKIKITKTIANQEITLPLNEFWTREAFNKPDYRRSDFSKEIVRNFSASNSTKIDSSIFESVGSFNLELYFIKNTPSTVEIVKPVVSSRRKDILKNFSGIKLYRDGFKVRPYGDEDGPSFDWLSLGVRAQRSPAAVSHESGSWRVRSNQIIGEVRITKESNPNLSDMANREGLAINDEYKAFVKLIEKIIEIFEADRQYIFKEYLAWTKEKERAISSTQTIVENAKKNVSDSSHTKSSSQEEKNQKNDDRYSREEYEYAILELEQERERQERATKTLMLYSSAGVMTNTFSHEISRIKTQAGSRMQHLRYAINKIVGENGYVGPDLFNPFKMIDQVEAVDNLLDSWLAVIMDGTDESSFFKRNINVFSTISSILSMWSPLLEKKFIKILPIKENGNMENCICNISEIDLLIILNNFLLNSADFLEKAEVEQRKILVSITDENNRIIIQLKNNGPTLDAIFSANPERIFDAGVSTKTTEKGKGSGIGLWITKTLVQNNSGEIHPIEMNDGFGLRICLPK